MPHLSNILHNKGVLLDALQRAHAPSPAVLGLKDAQVKLNALLDHSVGTVRSAAAPGVTFINGLSWPDPDLAAIVVGHAVQGGSWTTAVHWIFQAVFTVTTYSHLIQHNARADFVVVNVGEVLWRAL